MPRPFKERKICLELSSAYFKPCRLPVKNNGDAVVLEVDELEAVRLADMEGYYQEEAARRMGVSRQTFGNIISKAHAKIAQALIRGKALRINCPRFNVKSQKLPVMLPGQSKRRSSQ